MTLTLDSIRDIRLYQRKRGYRFSLDALLLFDFARLQKTGRIADLGAGSGVIGLLLAKKYPLSEVKLIELQEGLHDLALKNIALNGLAERVTAVKVDIREIFHSWPGSLEKGSFDMAVSNPPFRKAQTGRISADGERALARHELSLPITGLAKAAGYLVKNRGRFFMIYLPERLAEMFDALREGGFEPKRLRFVHGRHDFYQKPSDARQRVSNKEPSAFGAKMVLVESVRGASPGLAVESPLFVYAPDGGYSLEVRRILEA